MRCACVLSSALVEWIVDEGCACIHMHLFGHWCVHVMYGGVLISCIYVGICVDTGVCMCACICMCVLNTSYF